MNAYTELIDKYLNNELSAEERKNFEEQLKNNLALKNEFDLQTQVIKGAQRMGLKNEVRRSFKKTKLTKTILKTVIAATIAVAVIATGYFVKKQLDKNDNEIRYELNEEGNKSWSEADKMLPSQTIRINPLRDTVIETKGGILFAIEAGTFLNKFGEAEKNPVDIEIKEALTALDIMKAGLSTTSNGQLLETGGMFYLNAREGNENLDIDQEKPIQASVPYNGKRNDMMLFDGKREKDGSINWVNPIQTVRQLTTTDIKQLNFYPPGYLDSLRRWGYDIRDKKFTDSLYYSFICDSNLQLDYPLYAKTDSVISEESYTRSKPSDRTYEVYPSIDGKSLFSQNCAVCHSTTDQHLTGPGLRGVAERVPPGDWLLNYIKNPEKMIKSGDAYANKILRKNGGASMTVFEGTLTDADIRSIIAYITNGTGGVKIPESERTECPEINPSRIKAIWDKKFNNTFLATTEFEQRLQVIFKTCDDRILNLYVQNLDKNLYVLDSIAADMCSGEQKQAFRDFYKERKGGVRIDSKHMRSLQKYASDKKRIYEKAAFDAMENLMAEENKQNIAAFSERNTHALSESIRQSKVFEEELEMNLDEAYRQLGKLRNPAPPPVSYVSAPVSSAGWKNVDAYVIESTTNRTTLDYTDPQTGKKAMIQYKTATVNVTKQNEYDKVVAYLLPDKLSSFQLMKNKGVRFEENLNELLHYDLVVIGFKGNKLFYSETKTISAQSYTSVLKESTEQEVENRLNTSHAVSAKTDLLKDYKFQVFDQKENIRQKKIAEREKFKMKVYPIVFPCAPQLFWSEGHIIDDSAH
jgi:mono/diheme cytochrome c family protein